ncbi:hypothetical protein DNHGIG_00550 [Collibacillus ludicampi]|uniref:Phage tail tape measure protein domain-containing protein n=1 Tax=Collibacillus ludicampi TaxID=2771369 RepID=A0AAV4L9Q3_9BACL|nr:phage tail tape measure protein [Collibacillus ludicampi]GIM44506.1 hypothetical protein DNHGIG_00550 [Collibacillus ludicampi]
MGMEKAFELSVAIKAIDYFTPIFKQVSATTSLAQKQIADMQRGLKALGTSASEIDKITQAFEDLDRRNKLSKLIQQSKDAGLSFQQLRTAIRGLDAAEEQQKKLDALTASYEKFKKVALGGVAVAAAGVAVDYGMFKLAKSAGDVQMAQIQLGGVYGLDQTSAKLKEIDKMAQDLSQTTLFGKTDLYKINLELAHAGVQLDALKKIVPEATYLAEVEVGMGKSSSAEQTAYNFARMADDAGISQNIQRMQQFADMMYRGINITHANSESIGEAFKYSMPVVKNLGWTEQDNLIATLMEARAGVEGSMAGTHIKDFAERINPFKYIGTATGSKQLEAMADAGLISGIHGHKLKSGKMEITGIDYAALLKDKNSLRSYGDIVNILSQKHDEFIAKGVHTNYASQLSKDQLEHIQEQSKLLTGKTLSGGELEWAALMNKIFGEQGQDFAIISSHKDMYEQLMQQMNIQKSLHDQIGVIRDSFNGQLHIAGSNLQTIGQQLGKPLMESLVPVLVKVNTLLSKFMGYLNDHPKATKFFSLAAASALTFGGALISLAGIVGMLSKSLEVLGLKGATKFLGRGIGKGSVGLIKGIGKGIKGTVSGAKKIAKPAGLIAKGMRMGLAAPFAAAGKGVMAAGKFISSKALQGISKLPGLLSRAGSAFLRFGTIAMQAGGRVLLAITQLGAGVAKFAAQLAVQAVRMAASWLIALGPVGWIILGVIAIIALLWAAWKTNFGHIREHVAQWVQWIKQKFNEMVDWFKSLPDKMATIGHNIVEGIWNGIQSMWGWLKSKISAWIDDVVPAPIRKALGIQSPSRLMRTYGQFVAQGMALGINDHAHMVKSASNQLANAAVPDTFDRYGGFGSGGDTYITFHINGANQSPDQIADAVMRRLGVNTRMNNMSRPIGPNRLVFN